MYQDKVGKEKWNCVKQLGITFLFFLITTGIFMFFIHMNHSGGAAAAGGNNVQPSPKPAPAAATGNQTAS